MTQRYNENKKNKSLQNNEIIYNNNIVKNDLCITRKNTYEKNFTQKKNSIKKEKKIIFSNKKTINFVKNKNVYSEDSCDGEKDFNRLKYIKHLGVEGFKAASNYKMNSIVNNQLKEKRKIKLRNTLLNANNISFYLYNQFLNDLKLSTNIFYINIYSKNNNIGKSSDSIYKKKVSPIK